MLEFDMTDLGKMRYYLGIKIMQRSDGIFISKKKKKCFEGSREIWNE
jgi:hypothetical protein